MTTMTRTQRVLQLDESEGRQGCVRFTREPDEPGDIPTVVDLDIESWRDMGSPEVITVTIDPRDLLNDPT